MKTVTSICKFLLGLVLSEWAAIIALCASFTWVIYDGAASGLRWEHGAALGIAALWVVVSLTIGSLGSILEAAFQATRR